MTKKRKPGQSLKEWLKELGFEELSEEEEQANFEYNLFMLELDNMAEEE